jgi:hypothetical protein
MRLYLILQINIQTFNIMRLNFIQEKPKTLVQFGGRGKATRCNYLAGTTSLIGRAAKRFQAHMLCPLDRHGGTS